MYERYGEMCADESATFIRHVVEHGRIDIDDPRLGIRYVGNPYGTVNALD